MEVRELLPVMVRTLREISPERIGEAVLIQAPGMEAAIGAVLTEHGGDPRIQRVGGEDRRLALAGAALAWTASGTATLECTLLNVPMIVGYRLQPISFALAKLLVRVPNVALVNLIASRTVAPELLQKNWNPGKLAAVTEEMLGGGAEKQMGGLAEARARLGRPGASKMAAEAIAEYIE
jgi:lipid-A-disaccharide synthase